MKKVLITAVLPIIFAATASSEEHEVAAAPFEKVLRVEASLLPTEPVSLSLDPEGWESFRIKEVLPHGAEVRKGQAVVVLETEDLDRRIQDDEEEAKLRKKKLADAKRELANLESSTPRRLEASEREHQRAQEDLTYFREVGRKEKERSAHRTVERAERAVEYQEEELTQLLAMYREDDLTEETEEIILKRQRNTLKDAKDYLDRSRLSRERVLETELPREAEDLAAAAQAAELAWDSSQESLPRALEIKRLEVAALELADQRAVESLADLKADRDLMDLKASVDGWIYYGDLSKGSWKVGQTAKFMKEGGILPFKTIFATIIPKGASMQLHGKLDEGQLSGLRAGLAGTFAPKFAPRTRLPIRLLKLATLPDLSGKYAVTFSLPEGAGDLAAGMSGRASVVVLEADTALTVPAEAVHERGSGELYVKVKSEDGTLEERMVQLGAEADGRVVVEKGLQAGEVVLSEESQDE